MDENTQLLKQLNIVIGQIEGIKKMLEGKSDCLQIINQLKAVKSGLNKTGIEIITRKFKECLNDGKNQISEKDLETLLNSLSKY